MNGKDLLIALGDISHKYYDEAENETITSPKGHLSLRRPLLIAAIIAMMLLLVGCAIAYVLRLQELHMGEYSFIRPRYIDADGNKVYETEVTREVISLQGLAGSPSFQAAQEWFAFEQAYDPDYALLDEADKNPIDVPSDYDAYFVYTQEMVDKVDEITQKYGLELAGETAAAQADENDIFFDALGIEQLHREDADASLQYDSGYFFACGNFDMDFYITVTEENTATQHEVFGSYRYNGKAYFDTVFSSVSSIDDCEEWVYTASDGQNVLIVMDDSQAKVFCDRENAFISLHLDRNCRNADGTEASLTRKEVEHIVDCMDFSVTPQKPDMEATKKKLEESFEAYRKEQEAYMETYDDPFKQHDTYEGVIRSIMENGGDADTYLYALRDITGDGVEELFLGRDGSFGTIKTMEDGKPATLWSNGTDVGLDLCEGNILRYTNGDSYSFMDLNTSPGQPALLLVLGYDPWEESWYYTEDNYANMNYISKEAFDTMLDSYKVIDIGMKPVSEYPFT